MHFSLFLTYCDQRQKSGWKIGSSLVRVTKSIYCILNQSINENSLKTNVWSLSFCYILKNIFYWKRPKTKFHSDRNHRLCECWLGTRLRTEFKPLVGALLWPFRVFPQRQHAIIVLLLPIRFCCHRFDNYYGSRCRTLWICLLSLLFCNDHM